MNEHPQTAEAFELYALGLLEGDDLAVFERHLGAGCAACAAALARAQSTVGVIGMAAAPARASAAVRVRLRRAIAPRDATPARVWLLAAAAIALAVAAGWFGWRARQLGAVNDALRSERNQLQEQLRGTRRAQAEAQAALAIVAAPGTRVVAVTATPRAPAARAFYNANGLLLVGWHLQPLPAARTYEMWLLPPKGKPVPAGLFAAAEDGSALHVYRGGLAGAAAIAVSIEPAGGRPQPTGPIVLVAKLAG